MLDYGKDMEWDTAIEFQGHKQTGKQFLQPDS